MPAQSPRQIAGHAKMRRPPFRHGTAKANEQEASSTAWDVMSRIDRYILSQMLTLFGFFALVLVSVYWLNRALSLFEQLIADGQAALVVLELTLLTLPVVIALVLPVAAFAAVLYGINRLSGDSEIVAMQAAGMSPLRLARPVLVFGVLVGIMVAMLVHGLVPAARTRLADRQAELTENLTARFLQPGGFVSPAAGVTLYIRDIASDGRLLDLMLEDARAKDSRTLYTAREAVFVRTETGPRLVMLDGIVQQTDANHEQPRLTVTRFKDLSYDLDPLAKHGGRNSDLREFGTLALLRADPAMLSATGVSAERAKVTAHQRLAQPFLSPLAALIGFASLIAGSFSRFGLGRQIGMAIILLISLEFLNTATEDIAERNPASWPILYLPMLLGCLTIIFLLNRAGRNRKPREASA